MGHMKKLLALALFAFLFATPTSAHEGSIDLTGNGVSCKGISLYQDGYYRVFGRCDGLMYPYETTFNKYVLWGKTTARGENIRIAEVDKGYFSGNIASPFSGMVITAEADGLVRKPSDKQVVTGAVTIFDFDKSKVTATPAPASTTSTSGITVQNATEKVSSATSTAGSVVGKILTSLLVIILVIVGLVIGASLIFRSRGSVSH